MHARLQIPFLLLLATAPTVASQEAPAGLPGAPSALYGPLLRGDRDAALAALGSAREQRPQDDDFWLLIEARILAASGRGEEALERLQELRSRHPDSPWRVRGRFLEAEILHAGGRAADATALLAAEAERLRSPDRRRRLLASTLALADALADPEKAGVAGPDWQQAEAVYALATGPEAPPEVRELASYRAAVCRQAREQWADAAAMFDRYLAAFDPAADPPAAAPGPAERILDARLRRARCLRAAGAVDRARHDAEDLVVAVQAWLDGAGPWPAPAPGSADSRQAILLRGEARHLAAVSRADDAEEQLRAAQALRRFLEEEDGHPLAWKAAYELGGAWTAAGRHEEAAAAFAAFRRLRVPATAQEEDGAILVARALFRQGQELLAAGHFSEARQAWKEYVARYPAGADWAGALRGIGVTWTAAGRARIEAGDLEGGRQALRTFLEEHPLDSAAPQVLFELGDSYAKEAEDARGAGREAAALYETAVAEWRRLVRRFPESDAAAMGMLEAGKLLEERLGRLEEARSAWQAVARSPWQEEARQRLARLDLPSLLLRSPRTWRGEEAARLTVELRNVPRLELRLHALDLEAFFRRHAGASGLAALDLDLVEPDRVWGVPLEEGAGHALLVQEVELPVEGPGAWAVTARGERLQATTLVLRSDLELLVRSSRRQVLVFAEDMASESPASGAELLIAVDGPEGRRFLEARTEEDGTALVELPEDTPPPSRIAVLGRWRGQAAFAGLPVQRLAIAEPLAPRGHFQTDRSVYRPGSELRWRAILRSVSGGSFTFAEGDEVTAEVLDPRGRLLRREVLQLGALGTLHGSCPLPDSVPAGTGTLRCTLADGLAFQGSYRVADFLPPAVEIELEPEHAVSFPGDEVIVAVQARRPWGTPLAGATLVAELPDGRELRLRTDARGAATLRFPTRHDARPGPLQFQVRAAREETVAQTAVWIAASAFHARLSLPRDLYAAGERIPVRLETRDPGGRGVARAMTLRVYRRERAGQEDWREVLVSEQGIRTAEDGSAGLELVLDQGGSYLLRAEGQDRLGNPVFDEEAVQIAAEDGAARLDLLADRSTWDVGEVAELTILDRGASGLALVTYEADRFLGHRLLRVQPGRNALRIPLQPAHFPEMRVAVHAMQPGRLLEAEHRLEIRQELHIEIEAPAEHRPGERVPLRIRVTDQLGRPVAAALSLALLDETLLAAWPDGTPPLPGFFQDGLRRRTGMRSASSCTFRHVAGGELVAEAVLAEEERAALEKAWRVQRDALLAQLGDEGVTFAPAAPEAGAVGQLGARAQTATEEQEAWNDSFGLGGGAGGRYGRRAGRSRAASRAPTPPRALFEEAGFWLPELHTDTQGRATAELPLPARAGHWRLVARGVGAHTTTGQALVELRTRRDLVVEWAGPAWLRAGDRPRPALRVHNLAASDAHVLLELVAQGAGASGRWTRELDVPAGASLEHVFPELAALEAGELALRVTARARLAGGGSRDDRLADTLPVRPGGVPVSASRTGVLRDRARLQLELPAGAAGQSLLVLVGASPSALLLDALLDTGGGRPLRAGSTRDAVAARLLGSCAVLRLGGDALGVQADLLRERAALLTADLVASQGNDGGWSWSGTGSPDVPSTALALLALVRARDTGLAVPPPALEAALGATARLLQETRQGDEVRRALLLWARAAAGHGDFGVANRLHRLRARLTPGARALTTLLLAEMGRSAMARDVAALLEQEALPAGDSCRWSGAGEAGFLRNPLDLTALAVLALERALPSSPRLPAGVAWLRERLPASSGRARGLIVVALAANEGEVVPAGREFTVELRLPGREVLRRAFAPGDLVQRWQLPLAGSPREVTAELRLEGRGAPRYQVLLQGRAPEPPAPPAGIPFRIASSGYLASPPLEDGRPVPVGFSVVRREGMKVWRNTVREVALDGEAEGFVDYVISAGPGPAPMPLILEVPLPAGARLVPGGLSGEYLDARAEGGRLTVSLAARRGTGRLRYRLAGVTPGAWMAPPPALASADDPAWRTFGAPAPLTVLQPGETCREELRPTPDELHARGLAALERGDAGAARSLLERLYREHGDRLQPDPFREVARALLLLALDRGAAEDVVRYFEALRERSPETSLSLDDMLRAAAAYRSLDEQERAWGMLRAVLDAAFVQEARLPAGLEKAGATAEAIEAGQRLLLEHAPLPSMRSAALAWADQLLVLAERAAQDESLRKAGLDRARLTGDSIRLQTRFLALHPQDPLAPEAGLALVSTWLSLQDYASAVAAASSLEAMRAPPRFADAFRHAHAVGAWQLGQVDEAVGLLEDIVAARYPDESGRLRPSVNHDLAVFLLASIHHARGAAAAAIRWYQQVEDVFPEAAAALADLRRKVLSLPEITPVHAGEAARLAITQRNLEAVELQVQRVDLMTLYLREKDLSRVASVDLAGIPPLLTRRLELGGGWELRDRQVEIELPLAEPGAYLVMARAGNLHASGLVLVSDLDLEVREDAAAGIVRVLLRDAGSGAWVADAEVRVVGSGDGRIHRGRTDPRGVLVAEGVQGAATVIVRRGAREYAFHRGTVPLGRVRNEAKAGTGLEGKSLLRNIMDLNTGVQERRRKQQQEMLQELGYASVDVGDVD